MIDYGLEENIAEKLLEAGVSTVEKLGNGKIRVSMAEARRRVFDRFGVELQHEVQFLGPLELPPL